MWETYMRERPPATIDWAAILQNKTGTEVDFEGFAWLKEHDIKILSLFLKHRVAFMILKRQ